MALAGCLDDPPEYAVADRVPPVIVASGVQPVLTGIVPIDSTQLQIPFTVPFRCDDAGERLKAFVVKDIPQQIAVTPSSCVTCVSLDEPEISPDPRPFADQTDRRLTFTLDTATSQLSSCHTVTLILSRQSNFIKGWQMADPSDGAQVTWVIEVQQSDGAWPGCSAGTTGAASP